MKTIAMQVPTKTYYSPAEYLELETQAEQRSEYLDGQIIPMAGGKPNHNKIALNLSSTLNFALRGTAYDIFMSDLRLWIPNYRLYTYPDVMVVNTPLVFAENRSDTIVNPIMIAEILSDSTEKYDRGNKFRMYRTIPDFREYLLISQTAMQVEKFTKNDSDQWVLSEYATKESIITFDSFELEISLDELYDRVELS
ncbi:Uma2 family endonuclease [Pleurocapsa sp. FMAR1]|uniref:Uma2 family endonuclease n=1 Tax=Pleurocapsa sp. FMAR1 TaxID=3040204 RepID=UPI0029C6329B|nr:Uma2 family endonuclease [Pleurocapsa sp. FMAR1]